MGIPGSTNLLMFGGEEYVYPIEQSLRFDGSSGYLSRTHSNNNASSDFTLSMWLKKAYNGENNMMLIHTNPGTNYSYVSFGESSGDADLLTARGTSSGYAFNTSRKYRDSSAWYHIVLSVDVGTLTEAYVNGVLDQNTGATSGWYFNSNQAQAIGRQAGSAADYFSGYIAEVHFIDGQALDADSFGEFDDNGVWRPIEYTGTHGDNGYYLKFDPSATNGVGHDHSGNGNHWTASGFTTSAPGNGRYAPDCSTVSGGGSFVRAFDGSISTGVGSENYSGEIWTWEPDTAYSYSTSVEIYGGEAAYDQARINGGSWQALNGGWKTLASGSGSITKIEVRDSRGNAAASFNAFRVDGTFLVDNVYNVTDDVVPDTPTNNWSIMNPLHNTGTNGSQDGNLVIYSSTTAHRVNTGTISLSQAGGKYYAECWVHTTTRLSDRAAGFGFQVGPDLNGPTGANNHIIYSNNDQGRISSDGSTLANNLDAAMARDGDVYQLAFDAATGKAWVGMNNTWLDSSGGSTGDPATGANATFTLSGDVYTFASAYNNTVYLNFGQYDFVYDAPTDFDSVNTANMTEPDIADGSDYFNTVLYTGNGSTQSITGVGFQPDFLWAKSRDTAYGHWLGDVVRGGNERLASDSTQEGRTNEGNITFDTDGFSVTSSHPSINDSSDAMVAWNWLAGGSVSADNNTAGTINSTVSALPKAGFSIVSWAAEASAGTVGHGLGNAPQMIIMKARDQGTYPWFVYHKDTGIQTYGSLDSDGSIPSSGTSPTVFSTAPTSTLFDPGTGVTTGNSYDDMIAYCFAEVEGYSKIGSYTGNGTDEDGPFVYTGFAVSWLLVKRSSGTGDWYISDNKRNTYNAVTGRIDANTSDIENTANPWVDFLSNGFKIRDYDGSWNASGSTFIYVALASNPFGGSGISPATAR